MTLRAFAVDSGEGFALEGALHGGPVDGAHAVVVCHPHPAFGGTMDTPVVVALADACADAGLVALRFNFRGIEGSGGTPSGGLVEERDVIAAERALLAAGARAVSVVGYSFGALMAALAIARELTPRRFVALGFPSTIVGDDASRIASVRRALARVPSLLVSGTRDQFSELERLREWATAPESVARAAVVALDGVGHFYAGAILDDVVARAVAFVQEAA